MIRLMTLALFLAFCASPLRASTVADPLAAKMDKVISLKDPIDVALDLALTELADEHGLQGKIHIDKAGFKADGIEDVAAAMVKLPKLTDVPLRVVFDKLLQQVNGTWIIRDKFIEIITVTAKKAELNLQDSDPETPHRLTMPMIRQTFRETPLSKALEELGTRYDKTIILAPQVGDKTDAAVSVRFVNVPLDTAVELLAEMVDLKLVRKANVLYVTTADRAEPLLAIEEKRREIAREKEKNDLERQKIEAAKPVEKKN